MKFSDKVRELYALANSPSDPVTPSYMGKDTGTFETTRPIQHFTEFGDGGDAKTQWSIQTDRTHGEKGVVKISKTQMEDPKLSMKTTNPEHVRRAGAEDLFLGSKEGVVQYVKQNYPSTKIRFV